MRRALALICAIVIIFTAACKNTPIDSPEDSPSVTTTDSTEIISEADIDFDQNGEMEKLYVRMVTGEFKEEVEPGPHMGTYWEGEFRLELVAKDGSLLQALDLNPTFDGSPLLFSTSRSFDIAFEDYNDDGYLDFSIGQYFTSNGFTYNLYSLKPEGITVLHRGLFTADGKYSILYEKAGSSSFKNRYYDVVEGKEVQTLFTWQGDHFVRTECEGCGMAGGGAPNGEIGGFQLTVERINDGFQLAFVGSDDYSVRPTLVSPRIDGASYAVHIVRTNVNLQGANFSRDAIVVNPETAEYSIFPLYSALLDDTYEADSVATAYGFLDDRHLVYVSVVNDDNHPKGYFYRVEKLNIITGETTILIPEIPDIPAGDHFARGWLNEAKDTLVLNSYIAGDLWSFVLPKGEVIHLQAGISHSWPFYLTYKSPDGEHFWYYDYRNNEYRLYDKTGRMLTKAEFGNGYNQFPAFLWSTDSRFAANQDTRDESNDHIIGDNGQVYYIAPQRIRFFDKQGEQIRTVETDKDSGKYMEIAGWPDDAEGLVLLREYELDRSVEPLSVKINSRYHLLDIMSGDMQKLKMEPNFDQLTDPVPARIGRLSLAGPEQRLYWIDMKGKLIMVMPENGNWLSETDENWDAWVTYEDGAASAYHEFDSKAGQIIEKTLDENIIDIQLIGTEWLVWGEMNYTRLE